MAIAAENEQLTAVSITEVAEAVRAPSGDPATLGLPAFVVGSIVLGFSLVGYIPATAGGAIVPIIFAATGLGLMVAVWWAAGVGQTVVASIFGVFGGFWLSLSILVLGLAHGWYVVPTSAVAHSVAAFLISWAIVIFALMLATLRLPLAYSLVLGLVVLALVLRTFGVLNASTTMDHLAGIAVFAFAAVGTYLFVHVVTVALGSAGLPLGRPVMK
jgi:succinate-acetate transporter protein